MMKKIILFDGICVFCDSFVKFIVQRDNKKTLLLSPLQSKSAETLSKKYNFIFEQKNLSSIFFLKNDRVFKKSSAVIEIISELGGAWRLVKLLLIIPQKLRDFFYDFFAQNRYRWFGKKEFCEFDDKIRKRII